MPDVSNPALFEAASQQLSAYRRSATGYRGRFVQIFLAMKFYQNELPSMYSGQFVSTEVLQTLLDDLYAKASRPLNDCVFVLFENGYLARTGTIGLRNTTPQNTWRNNLNLQKGVGCYASPAELSSPTFLGQARNECRYLISGEPGRLAGGNCRWCPTSATYRSESHRKWLRIDPGGNGYAVLDLLGTDNFAPYVAPEGMRIPLIPLIVALYHDALPGLNTARQVVEVADFASDFNFSQAELQIYFEPSPDNQFNRAVLDRFPEAGLGELMLATGTRTRLVPRTAAGRPTNRALPIPTLTGTPVPPPATNSGWEAEQYVAAALRADEWTVFDVSRQRLGYDLLAKKGRQIRYIDVKSSLGMCSPTLTAREWSQANRHGDLYVLAIIENFDPRGQATIYWVPNPANRCPAREASQIFYALTRASWVTGVVGMNDI